MEEKFHLLVALTRLVTVYERNIDTYNFIGEPREVELTIRRLTIYDFIILVFGEDFLLVIYFKGHRVEASITHNKDSSMNRDVELIVLLPEIKRRCGRYVSAKYFRLLEGSEEIVIQLNIKRMRAYRKALQVDDNMCLLAHRRKIGCKITAFF